MLPASVCPHYISSITFGPFGSLLAAELLLQGPYHCWHNECHHGPSVPLHCTPNATHSWRSLGLLDVTADFLNLHDVWCKDDTDWLRQQQKQQQQRNDTHTIGNDEAAELVHNEHIDGRGWSTEALLKNLKHRLYSALCVLHGHRDVTQC